MGAKSYKKVVSFQWPPAHVVVLVIIAVLFSAGIASGNVFDAAKDWFSWGAVALISTGIIAVGSVAARAIWLSKILIAVGTLLLNMGLALQDKKITKDELKQIKTDIVKIKSAFKAGVKSE